MFHEDVVGFFICDVPATLLGYTESSYTESLWQFKRDEQNMNHGNPGNVITVNSSSFKYKLSIFKPLAAADNGVFKNKKIAVPLKYLSNFWRSLEMPLINCKIHLELNWTKDFVMSTIADRTFKITNTKLYAIRYYLIKQRQCKTDKTITIIRRPACWKEYQTKIETRNLDNNNLTGFPHNASIQRVRILFLLVFDKTDNGAKKVERNSHTKYFPPRVDITNYNVLIHGRNFYYQSVKDQIKRYDEIRKTAAGQGDDYTADGLLDYQYFKDHYQLIAIDISKQKELDADSRAIQQIEFYGMLKTDSQFLQF